MINSKQKGNRNERVACKFMEEWTGKDFIRVANSGGIHNEAIWLAGDIVPVDIEFMKEFDTVVETKHLKYLGNLEGTRSNSIIPNIMRQCETDMVRVGASNCVGLLRQNRIVDYVVVVRKNDRNNRYPWFLRLDDYLLFWGSEVLNHDYKDII